MMLQGKCALITGSTQGLGLAAAQRFAAAGCNVVINGFGDEREIAAMRAAIEKEHGVRTMYCGANLAHANEIERMIGLSLEAVSYTHLVGVAGRNGEIRAGYRHCQ